MDIELNEEDCMHEELECLVCMECGKKLDPIDVFGESDKYE